VPIQLTTSLDYHPGHGQSSESYSQVKIVEFVVATEEKACRIRMQYGNTVNNVWQAGKMQDGTIVIKDSPAELVNGIQVPASYAFSILAASSKTLAADEAQPADGGHNCYVGTARTLYTWLIVNGYYEGIVV
jgi:hypothetical protein